MLEATSARHPQRAALVWRDAHFSWETLASAVRARAAELHEAGVASSDAVVLLLPNCPDFVARFFGAISLGAVAAPLDPGFRLPELIEALRGCTLGAIVACDATAEVATDLAAHFRDPVPVLRSDLDLPEVAGASRGERRVVPGDADALLGFSSGTTGSARRFARSHDNLVQEASNFTASVDLGPEDVVLGVAPFFHAHGLGNAVLAAVCSGATLVIEERFHPRDLLGRIREQSVSVFAGVPFMFRTLADVTQSAPSDLGSLRLAFSAGAPLTRDTFEAFDKRFGVPVRQLYGCSEAGSVSINLDPDAAGTWDSVGRPVRGVEVQVIDDSDSPCAPGEVGRIALASPAATCAYHGGPDPEAFDDGWFLPGDLGRLDDAGRLYLTGRTQTFLSTSVGKVEPAEIERCIAAHAEVREVVVVGVPSRAGDERAKAVVVPRNAGLTPAEAVALRRAIVAHCRERLAEFKVPRLVEFRSEIPRSSLGKILRRELVREPDPTSPRG
ncbi:MAG: AMP-binding protein [Deltaproteobacteria bacterium]|nr:AMP-binding protein [Deltaproteobacteria bacterium]